MMVAMVAGGVLTMVGIWIGFNQQLSDFGREKGKPGKGKKKGRAAGIVQEFSLGRETGK